MCYISGRSISKRLCLILVSLLSILIALSPMEITPSALAQGGALDSTIALQMPFIAGETWTVGGVGSFYGDGDHTNANNDYHATDWNRVDDSGAAVLPVADGVVSAVYPPPCPAAGTMVNPVPTTKMVSNHKATGRAR